MDGPGHDKECADNDNETYIFAGGMLNPSRTVEGEEVIAAGGRGQERTQFLVMPFPMLLQDERKNCNSDEQNRERREERRRRLHDCGGHRCRLLVGALVFETLWLRLSGLSFGNSVWAAALILSSFMAGLALGNAIAASSRFRRWRPLHLYAVLELAVAFFGCTIVFGLPLLGELMRPVWQMLWNYQPTLIGLRFVLSFLILLIPTTAMGLTLPVLVEDPILRLYVRSSSTAFEVMLAVVLAGIGLGSIVAGAIHRRSARLNQLLPVLLLLAAIATLSSYLFFPGEVVQTRAGVFDVSWQQIGLLSIALIFPVAFLSGILFPSIVACVQASVE